MSRVTVDTILNIAAAELGYKESPAGSNRTKYGAWFGMNGQPWCMMFVQWVFHMAGAADMLPTRTASCGALMRAAENKGMLVRGDYQPGDIPIFDFPGGAETDHCGFVHDVTPEGLICIEGNTAQGNDANGGQVQRRPRPLSVVKCAVRPKYIQKEGKSVVYKYLSEVPEKFRPTIETLMNAGIIQGDGSDRAGNNDVIDLTHEQVRTLVFVYRGGGFDKQLQAKGLPPAVRM